MAEEFNNSKGAAHTLQQPHQVRSASTGLLQCPREGGLGMKCTGRVGSNWERGVEHQRLLHSSMVQNGKCFTSTRQEMA